MTVEDLLRQRRADILTIAARHGASDIRIFGSVARREADVASDVDFIVHLEAGRSLFDLGALVMDLRDLLGRQVDVVTDQGLRPRFRERVLSEAVPL
jgi:predicted nucleotidyltransferase